MCGWGRMRACAGVAEVECVGVQVQLGWSVWVCWHSWGVGLGVLVQLGQSAWGQGRSWVDLCGCQLVVGSRAAQVGCRLSGQARWAGMQTPRILRFVRHGLVPTGWQAPWPACLPGAVCRRRRPDGHDTVVMRAHACTHTRTARCAHMYKLRTHTCLQTRLHLPVWLGIGEALHHMLKSDKVDMLHDMYQNWPFFQVGGCLWGAQVITVHRTKEER